MNMPEENPESNKKASWPARLFVISLLLFAIFWSVGPFFFWTLFWLSVYFAFLSLYTSESVAGFFSRVKESFGNQPTATTNPYQTFRPRTPGGVPARMNPRALVAIIIIGFFTFFIITTIIAVFSSSDETPVETETESIVESPAEDDKTTYWNERGNAALQNDLRDSALYYYDKALEIDPQNVYALYNKGLAYVLGQDYRRGNGYARRCLTYHPDYDPAWWLLGYSYDLTNTTDSALFCLEKAYFNGYSQPDFVQLMAEVYVKKDRREDALAAYKKLVDLDTTKVDAWRKMAELDPSNSEVYLKKARALER